MALVDDTPRVKAALAAIPGIMKVTESWPKEGEKLPCIAVEIASVAPHTHAADRRYASELAYNLRLFAADVGQRRELSSAMDDVMLGLGYLMELVYHENSQGRMSVMRYSTIMGG